MTHELIGLMSGTSLDGLDLCHCTFEEAAGQWDFGIHAAATRPYPPEWRARLAESIALPRDGLLDIDRAYGSYLATAIDAFAREHGIDRRVAVASHGHTVHHVPAEGYTRQIGDPQVIADASGRVVVADFRSGDVALGGQGAPLVPMADRLLFGQYAACVNLGGIANLSYERDGRRVAGDVTVCNLLSDRLAARLGRAYDAAGALARAGQPDRTLLARLAHLDFLQAPMPKSLGREWLEREVWPLYTAYLATRGETRAATIDALSTAGVHLATELARAVSDAPQGQILVTGGGAYNAFVMEGFRQNLTPRHTLDAVSPQLIDYKEALAFALLGALRLRGEINILASVTGARRDSSGGVVCHPSDRPTRAFDGA